MKCRSFLSMAISLLVLFALQAPVGQAAEPPLPGALDALLQQFTSLSPGLNGFARAGGSLGFPAGALFGKLAPPDPGGPLQTAQGFLKTFGPLLGFPPDFDLAKSFSLLSTRESGVGKTLILAPVIDRLPYLRGQIALQIDQTGNLVGVFGGYFPFTGVVKATIDGRGAVQRAIAALRQAYPGSAVTGGGTAIEYLDASQKGNLSRFINHSCAANAETQKWVVAGEIRIGLFARERIDVDTEITFDYQYERYGMQAQKCYCNAPNCRGLLGGDKQVCCVTLPWPGGCVVEADEGVRVHSLHASAGRFVREVSAYWS
jgi:hypothetical protein